MKYLIIALLIHFATLGTAQSSELNQINKLITSFKADKKVELLDEAQLLLTDLFANENYSPNLKALTTKAELYALLFLHTDIEEPLDFAREIQDSYSNALSMDIDMTYRKNLLINLYFVKIRATEYGNKAYKEEQYDLAHQYYKYALNMNTLEVDYPRHATVDSSLLFTSAVFAKLAKKDDEAISALEKLKTMNYQRKEIYDYLLELYGKMEGKEADVQRIQALKDERFPD